MSSPGPRSGLQNAFLCLYASVVDLSFLRVRKQAPPVKKDGKANAFPSELDTQSDVCRTYLFCICLCISRSCSRVPCVAICAPRLMKKSAAPMIPNTAQAFCEEILWVSTLAVTRK